MRPEPSILPVLGPQATLDVVGNSLREVTVDGGPKSFRVIRMEYAAEETQCLRHFDGGVTQQLSKSVGVLYLFRGSLPFPDAVERRGCDNRPTLR